jgi:hypothetical protein
MYIFGGYDSNGFHNDDVWQFSFTDATWTRLECSKGTSITFAQIWTTLTSQIRRHLMSDSAFTLSLLLCDMSYHACVGFAASLSFVFFFFHFFFPYRRLLRRGQGRWPTSRGTIMRPSCTTGRCSFSAGRTTMAPSPTSSSYISVSMFSIALLSLPHRHTHLYSVLLSISLPPSHAVPLQTRRRGLA